MKQRKLKKKTDLNNSSLRRGQVWLSSKTVRLGLVLEEGQRRCGQIREDLGSAITRAVQRRGTTCSARRIGERLCSWTSRELV